MQAPMQASYFERIRRAVALIEGRLADGEAPSLEELAEAAVMSKFHFHRVFRILTGETCNQTVKRLRLARGAGGLADGTQTVTDAALDAGYATSQAFAKAVRAETGQTASSLKRDPDKLAQVIEKFSVPEIAGAEAPEVSVELVSLDPFEVVAIRTEGIYPDLNATYHRLFEIAGGQQNVAAIIGIPQGDIDAGDIGERAFDCALRLGSMPQVLPDDANRLEVRAGKALWLRHRGGYDGLQGSVDRLYGAAIGLGAGLADRPCLYHYLDDPEETPERQLRTDTLLPVAGSIG